MDTEKIELYFRLLNLSKVFSQALNTLAKNPEDEQALEAVSRTFQALHPHIPDDLSEQILYLFSGAEIEPEDLQRVGEQLKNMISETVCSSLTKWMNSCTYIGQSDAENLFPLWDEIPSRGLGFYQGMFDFCMKASVSVPMQAFQHTLRIFEEQPNLLSGKETPHPGYVYRPSDQRTFDRCPVCGGVGGPYYSAFAYQMADFSYPHLPVKLWMKCSSCGNLYTWKYPKAALKCSVVEGMITPDPTKKLTAVAGTNGMSLSIWSDILNKLHAYTDGRDLLEVGIGKGELLAVALEMGYRPDAVEIFPETAHKVADMLEIPVWCGDFLNYTPKKTYSIITMGDVIEHVTNPEKALKNANSLLKENGVLWLSTPNYESSFSRMMKFRDPMWMEPHHISYFSRKGIEALITKCGFSLQEYCVSKRYNGSMELILTKQQF